MPYNENANRKSCLTRIEGGKWIWHFLIFLDGLIRQQSPRLLRLAVLRVALVTSLQRSRLPAVLRAALVTSLQRSRLPAVLRVVLVTSLQRSRLPAALRVALATSSNLRDTPQENLGAYFREDSDCCTFGNTSHHHKEEHMKQYFSFQWHITDECDQRCKHCYIFSENCNKKLDAMSWQQMQDTFYNCLDFCKVYDRLPYFYITGGDPILHPDFWKLLELMKQHSVPFTILGNPFHLTDEVCRRLKEYGCEKYQLSIDGLRQTHDWFRKPGSFDITLEKIGCINRAGIRSVVMTTVSGTNIDEVPGIIDAVVAAGANVFAFARYCPTSEEKDVGIEPLRYRQLLADCDRKFKEYEAAGCQTYFNKKDHLWTLYEYETGAFKIPETLEEGMIYGGCNCGNCHLTILPTGDVYACRRVQNSKVANVFTDRLADVWVCQMEQYRDYTKFEKCSKCELLAFCRGCPAVASGKDGNFYAADPQCWKEVKNDA